MDRKSGEGMRVGLNNRVVFDAAPVSIRASQEDRDVRGILDVIIMNVPVLTVGNRHPIGPWIAAAFPCEIAVAVELAVFDFKVGGEDHEGRPREVVAGFNIVDDKTISTKF